MFEYTISETKETGVVDAIELQKRFPDLMPEVFYNKLFVKHTVVYNNMSVVIERIV